MKGREIATPSDAAEQLELTAIECKLAQGHQVVHAAPFVDAERVWVVFDDGTRLPGRRKALREMGV